MPEQFNVDWTDLDGDRCHVLLGHDAVQTYCGPCELPDGVVGLVEVRSHHEEEWTPVYVDQANARALHEALGKLLAPPEPTPEPEPRKPNRRERKPGPTAESITTKDGTVFSINSYLIRGERRFHLIQRREPDVGEAVRDSVYDGSYDKRTAVRRLHRRAAEWEAEHAGT